MLWRKHRILVKNKGRQTVHEYFDRNYTTSAPLKTFWRRICSARAGIVYLCPGEIVRDRTWQEKWPPFSGGAAGSRSLFFWRQVSSRLTVFCASSSPSAKIPGLRHRCDRRQRRRALRSWECLLRKGRASLYLFPKEKQLFTTFPARRPSRRFCTDLLVFHRGLFLMAGGNCLPGRVDNHVLSRYLPDF